MRSTALQWREWCVSLLAVALLGTSAPAADLEGAKDPGLKRFAGSEIVGYEVKRFDTYELQTSTFVKTDLKTKRRSYVQPPVTVEGTLTRVWYEAPGETSATELLRNYQDELRAKGYEILYDSAKDPAAGKWTNFLAPFSPMQLATSRSHYVFYAADERTLLVCSARKGGHLRLPARRAVAEGQPDVQGAARGVHRGRGR